MFNSYKEIFTKRGASYHEAMTRWPDARRQEFLNVIQHIQLDQVERIADIPSGGGYCGRYVPQHVELFTVDESPAFIAETTVRDNTHAICAPIHQTGIDTSSIDGVWSIAGLHHVDDKIPFFKEVHRILKPGGTFTVADAAQGSTTAEFLDSFVSSRNSSGHTGRYLTPENLEELAATGFEIESSQNSNYPWVFDTPLDMAEFCRLLFGLDLVSDLEQLQQDMRDTLKVEVAQNSTHLQWSLFTIVARKPLETK